MWRVGGGGGGEEGENGKEGAQDEWRLGGNGNGKRENKLMGPTFHLTAVCTLC